MKRRHANSEGSDSENVDPSTLKSAAKRKRIDEEDSFKPTKAAQYALHTVPSNSTSAITPSRLDTRLATSQTTTPVSAPAAGRSPKSKRIGILSRRRTGSAPVKRIDPPAFSRSHATRAPLSLAAALSGTVPSYKPKKIATLEESMPKSWFFDIHEETEQEQEANIMLHSTGILDISDDEGRSKDCDGRGKENVPPHDAPGAASHAVSVSTKSGASRKDMMTDEPRTPLGDLNATDFYAEGCDASSVVVVPADDTEKTSSTDNVIASNENSSPTSNLTFESTTNELLDKADLDALIRSTAPSAEAILEERGKPHPQESAPTDTEIEIWESGSAAEEAAQTEEVIESIFAV